MMALLQNFHKYFKDHLATSAVFTSFPMSLLVLGLEALVDVKFQFPRDTLFNAKLTLLMFTAPPCFAFMVMFLLTRPFKNTNIWCCLGCITFSLCLKSFLHCLIPPLVWVLLLLYDGDYLACALTNWDGVYTYNETRHIRWCEPEENKDSKLSVTFLSIVMSKVSVPYCIFNINDILCNSNFIYKLVSVLYITHCTC